MSAPWRWAWIGPVLLYAASALEIFIMISPFAAYFYSVYTPLLHGLTQSAITAWLPQFFLPHLARTDNLLLHVLSYAGPALAVIGILGFLICAGQLYYGKFVRKRLVTTWLYGRVRHPQYLCLGVAGSGFLLMWPRFIILMTYLMMLGLYYLLARHEEDMVLRRYGKPAAAYMARIAMFNPFRAPQDGRVWQPPARRKALALWLALCIAGVGGAFLLRRQAIASLNAVRLSSPAVTVISFAGRDRERITAMAQAVLATSEVRSIIQQDAAGAYLIQIATGKGEITHLLTDLGMKAGAIQAIPFFDEDEYAVMSRLTGSQPQTGPFALDTRMEPAFLVRPDGSEDGLEIRAFIPEQFYPDFARVMF